MPLRHIAMLGCAALAVVVIAPVQAQDDAVGQILRSQLLGSAVRAVWVDFTCDRASVDQASLAALLDAAQADLASLAGPYWDIRSAAHHAYEVIGGASHDGVVAFCDVLAHDLIDGQPGLVTRPSTSTANAPLDPRVRLIIGALLAAGAGRP